MRCSPKERFTLSAPQSTPKPKIGTYAYADPEQRAGRPTPSSDLYSLAATCVEMMTRRRPALELFCDWEPGRCPEGDFGAELGAALARMLRRSVAGRFAAAADAAEALFGPARALPAGPGADGGESGRRPRPRPLQLHRLRLLRRLLPRRRLPGAPRPPRSSPSLRQRPCAPSILSYS
eukprot:tig00000826_g4584.t2